MNIDRYLMIKTAKSSTAEDFSTLNAGSLNRLVAKAKGTNLNPFKRSTFGTLKDDRSALKKYDQAQNAGLAMALGYGNNERKLRQALAIGGIGAGTIGGGALGFYGGRAAADALGLDSDSSLARRIGRYALMTGGTLGGAGIGGSLAAAGVGAGLGDYTAADAVLAKNIADNSDLYARKVRGEGKGILGNALLGMKRRLGEGITLADRSHAAPTKSRYGAAMPKPSAAESLDLSFV